MEVVVEYDYAAEEPDELTIKKGDIIKEVSQFEEGWYIGNLNGKIGVFPDNFVRSRTPVADQKKLGQSTVEMVKEPIGDSSYDNGRGSATGKHVTGIGLGNIFSGEPIQLKQPKLKDMMKESESNSERTTVVTKGDGPRSAVTTDLVRARFDYQPKQTDELELRVDDVIQVIDRDLPDEGWWKGKNLRSKKIGLFPDNFVSSTTAEPPEESDNRAQTNGSPVLPKQTSRTTGASLNLSSQLPLNSPAVQSSPEPPAVAAKPTPTVNTTHGPRSASVSGLTSVRDSQKVSIASAPNYSAGRSAPPVGSNGMNTTPTSATPVGAGGEQSSGVTGTARNVRWKAGADRADVVDRPKSQTEHNLTVTADLTASAENVDSSNVRLSSLTGDRPRQTGRRLPSKFTRPASPITEPPADTGADADIPQQTLRAPADKTSHSNAATPNSLTVSNMDNQAPPDVGEIRRSYTTSRIADQTSRSQRINIPGQVRSDFLHRSEGGSGSADLIRTGDVAVNKNSSGDGQQQQQQQSQQPQQQQWQALEKLQSQYEQLQAHHNQHVNESKQQIRELKRHLDQLRESHSQLRSDMIQNQRAMTERLQTLMNEVDDAKKQRASDAIELTRLRTMLMQLDAKSLITPNLGQGYSSTKHHRPSVDRSEENGNSRNDDDPEETNNESLRSPVNRSVDGKGTEHTNLNNAQAIGNKITSTGRTAPPLRPRPTHTPKYLHT